MRYKLIRITLQDIAVEKYKGLVDYLFESGLYSRTSIVAEEGLADESPS